MGAQLDTCSIAKNWPSVERDPDALGKATASSDRPLGDAVPVQAANGAGAKTAAVALTRNSVRRAPAGKAQAAALKPGGSERCSEGSAGGGTRAGRQRGSAFANVRDRCAFHLDANVQPNQRVVVIGDLHGMLHKVRSLWRLLVEVLGEKELLKCLVIFLGDYCDRGLYTRDLLSWLASLQRSREMEGARTVFLLGNHEFCLLSFLGVLPSPSDMLDELGQTWSDVENGYISRSEQSRWWGDPEEDKEILESMHLQGRRWAGSWYEKNYGSPATFESYGVSKGDRDGLLKAMPKEHVEFLRSCSWVHVENSELLGRCVFVHAGLEADGSEECEAQIERLQRRDPRHPQPPPLFGRDAVLHTPPQLARRGTTVISGHHGRVMFRTHRVILDSCCGEDRNPLAAVILPETLLIYSDGAIENRGASCVFAGRPAPQPARAAEERASVAGAAAGGGAHSPSPRAASPRVGSPRSSGSSGSPRSFRSGSPRSFRSSGSPRATRIAGGSPRSVRPSLARSEQLHRRRRPGGCGPGGSESVPVVAAVHS